MPGKGKLGTITHSLRIRALLLHRLSGTPGKLFFPTKVFSLAGVRDGGVRVGSYTNEGIRVKAKTLVHVRAARLMVERSLLTCLSSLCDVYLRLVPGIGHVHPRVVPGIYYEVVQNNHASHSYTSTFVASIIGDASQVCFPRRFFSWLVRPMGA